MQGDVVDIVHVGLAVAQQGEFLTRIIDEGAELVDVVGTHAGAEELRYLAFDVAGGIFENMAEGLIFTVYVGHKMLGAFGQVEYGLEIDDFCGG